VTFALQPFSVTTAGNPTVSGDLRYRPGSFERPVVTIGGVAVTVQFYGDAPCCPGLQQINVQLTPQLAGAAASKFPYRQRKDQQHCGSRDPAEQRPR